MAVADARGEPANGIAGGSRSNRLDEKARPCHPVPRDRVRRSARMPAAAEGRSRAGQPPGSLCEAGRTNHALRRARAAGRGRRDRAARSAVTGLSGVRAGNTHPPAPRVSAWTSVSRVEQGRGRGRAHIRGRCSTPTGGNVAGRAWTRASTRATDRASTRAARPQMPSAARRRRAAGTGRRTPAARAAAH